MLVVGIQGHHRQAGIALAANDHFPQRVPTDELLVGPLGLLLVVLAVLGAVYGHAVGFKDANIHVALAGELPELDCRANGPCQFVQQANASGQQVPGRADGL